MPASATIPAGARQVNFVATSTGVSANTTVRVTAASTQTRIGTVTINKAMASSLVGPDFVTGGHSLTLTLHLSGKAGTGGLVYQVLSSDPHATAPASVTVPAGATSVSFTVNTTAGTAQTQAIVYCISPSNGVIGHAVNIH